MSSITQSVCTQKPMFFCGVVYFLFFLSAPFVGHAATLRVVPPVGSHTVDDVFTMTVVVDSTTEAMNAASAVLSFSPSIVAVRSIAKEDSIFDFWVEEPSYSNTTGTIAFEGIALNPGFSGLAGTLLEIEFQAKKIGSTPLAFLSGSVLANDGQGTNILSTLDSAKLVVGFTPVIGSSTPTPIPTSSTIPTPVVVSETNQDASVWYNNSNPSFFWKLPSEVTRLQTLVTEYPDSLPTITYSPPIAHKTIENMPDGTWYFHIRFGSENTWGDTAHIQFNIDTEPPYALSIDEKEREDPTDPIVGLIVRAIDTLSGIDHYLVSVDEHTGIEWDGSGVFETEPLNPGIHKIRVAAFDGAGNSTFDVITTEVSPLKPPTLINYNKKVRSEQDLVVEGHSDYPDGSVRVLLKDKSGQTLYLTGRPDADGHFRFTLKDLLDASPDPNGLQSSTPDRLKSGTYTVTAEAVDVRGARSTPAGPLQISIRILDLLTVGIESVNALSIVVPFVVLVVALAFLLLWCWYHLIAFRDRLQSEIEKTLPSMKEKVYELKQELDESIVRLKQTRARPGMGSEKQQLLKQLKDDLKKVDVFLKEHDG